MTSVMIGLTYVVQVLGVVGIVGGLLMLAVRGGEPR